jgi:hypothetical protein
MLTHDEYYAILERLYNEEEIAITDEEEKKLRAYEVKYIPSTHNRLTSFISHDVQAVS